MVLHADSNKIWRNPWKEGYINGAWELSEAVFMENLCWVIDLKTLTQTARFDVSLLLVNHVNFFH